MLTELKQSKQEPARYHRRIYRLVLAVILLPALAACGITFALERISLARLHNAQYQQEESEVLAQAASTIRETCTYLSLRVQYRLTGDERLLGISKSRHQLAVDSNNALSRLPVSQSGIKARRNQIVQVISEGLRRFDEQNWLKPLDTPSPEELHTFAQSSFVLPTALLKIMDEEFARTQALQSESVRLDNLMYGTVILGMVVSLIMAVSLVAIFTRWITSRIFILVTNAGKIHDPDSMQPLKGDDEFCYINDALYQTARQLRDAIEQRKAVVHMIAHDVRSPLSSANLSLALFEKHAAEETRKRLAGNVSVASNNLNAIVRFVSDLLETERRQLDADSMHLNQKTHLDLRKPEATLRHSVIFKKLLAVVLLPMTIQLGWLVFIFNQTATLHSFAAAEEQQLNSLFRSSQVRLRLLRMISSLPLFLVTRDVKFKQYWEADRQHVKRLVDETTLKALLFEHDRDAASNWTKAFSAVEKLGDESFHASGVFAMLDILHQMSTPATLLEETNKKAELIQDAQTEILAYQESQLRGLLNALHLQILCGLLFNIALAAALVAAFSKDIDNRLSKLLTNIDRLKDYAEPYRPVGGSDEISLLDDGLRSVKQSLADSAKQRRFLIARMGDNLALPLLMARAALEEINDQWLAGLPPGPSERLDGAAKSIEHVGHMVDDFLAADQSAGMMTLHKRACSISEIVDECLDYVRALAEEKRIELISEIEPISINADKGKIVQALTNLLSNAIKFSQPGSRVRLHSESEQARVKIAVSDEGPGMDTKAAAHIFDRFFQVNTPQKREGFGLGLCIVKDIVESHGGTVDVVSQPNKGSMFSISIPAN